MTATSDTRCSTCGLTGWHNCLGGFLRYPVIPCTYPDNPGCLCDKCDSEKIDFTPTEVRSVSSTGGEKGTKLARYDLLPVGPLRAVAEHYGKGASKYADHNWRRGYEWSKSYAALQRHATQFWGGEDIDEETGSHHMAAVAFHALALLEFAERFPDFDDRFKDE